jgi:putative phage-type endonuclease
MPRLTKEELAHRKNGMGSTDVVEALGLAPWEGAGPMRVYMSKITDDVDDGASDEMDWGHHIEPLILAWYEQKTGAKVVPGGHVPHRDHPWLWASLDGSVFGGDRNVEIKNVGANMAKHWDTYAEDGVPRYVRAQVIIGMACTGKRLCDVVASVGGRPPHIWTVAWDEELWQVMLDEASEFWHRVLDRVPPPLDHTAASKEYLRIKYPAHAVDRVIVEASSPAEMIAANRITAAQHEKRSKILKDKLDAELLDMVGTHDGLKGDTWQMTWRVGKDGKRKQRFTAQGDDDNG